MLFLKGCPLRCQWCSTPESQRPEPEKGFTADRCTGCGVCVRACPSGALALAEDGRKVRTDFSRCSACFTCVAKCPYRVQKQYGRRMTVEDAVREISKDEIFFFHSGGGVTISGGEPLSQPVFAAEVLRECKLRGIQTAMETSLLAPWESVEKILPWLDVLFVDLKHMDNERHRQWVGPANTLIHDNLQRIARSANSVNIIVRIPLIPGVNDTDENLVATAAFCRALGKLTEVELLPYHRLGMETYRNLDMDYPLKGLAAPSPESILERARFLLRQNPGVPVRVGGETLERAD